MVTAVLLLAVAIVGVAPAAAHNPACHQVAGADGPHYDEDAGTGSDTAFANNPNLRDPDREESEHPDHAESIHNREGSCSVGNAQSGDGGH